MTRKFTVQEALSLVGELLKITPRQVVEIASAINYLRSYKLDDSIDRILAKNSIDESTRAGLEFLKQKSIESRQKYPKGGEESDLTLNLQPEKIRKLRKVTIQQISSLDKEIREICKKRGLNPSLTAESAFRVMPNEEKRKKLINLLDLIE